MGNCVSVSVPADKIVSDCKEFCAEKLNYKAKLKDDLDTLGTETEKLMEMKRDVERRVYFAEKQPSMRRFERVGGWLKRVEALENEMNILKTSGAKEVANLCLGGLCYKDLFNSSYESGEKVVKMLARVAALKEEGEFESVAAEAIQDDLVCETPCETSILGSESTFVQLCKSIEEDQVGTVGLYGMAVVGKSGLLRKLNNKLGKAQGDSVVIWVSVDRCLNLEDIQTEIAKSIRLFNESWMSKTLEEKALCIYKVLIARKFVLSLDNIWERVDLTKAGVPLPNPENKSKVVFTTRLAEVCGQMDADEQFKVECLTDEEAWELFASKVGDVTLQSHHQIPDLARTLAKECGGLPPALVTVARGMAWKRTPQDWEGTIDLLKTSAHEFPGMVDNVFRVLKLSYDRLNSDTIRSCFAYCCLFPQGYVFSKSELIGYWMSEGFLDDKNGSLIDGFRKIGVLVNACLLEEVGNDHVKMHNVTRGMAMWIKTQVEKETENIFVQADCELAEMPDIGEWQDVKRVSLMRNQIENVTEIPTACPGLITLFLNGNRLKRIGDGFFQAMQNLKVLNLSNNPDMTELPIGIAGLVSLQHLDVSKTGIKELPKELKSLLQLKSLNLEHTCQLHLIPQQLISGFLNLQVLRMLECGSSSTDIAKFLDEELLLLKRLVMLTITLKSSHAFKVFFSSKKLQSCTQSLTLQSIPHQKCLKALSADFKNLDTLQISDWKYLEEFKIDSALELLSIREACGFRSLRIVIISGCFKLRDLTWLILAPELKSIAISCCLNMTKIINEETLFDIPEKMRNTIPFSKLESLELQQLENLHSIYSNTLPFQSLNKIRVIGCPDLKTLPLDSNSAQEGRIVIECEQQWWQRLVWEDEATENTFSPCFANTG
ncbi:hypothetical protein Dsin_023555 [Dipteronia sinensis]|uniref:NB-ARC domain-containing protein n=1 Tax=Dipteronia sinensis TaxID=43782 RepID=A0AAE0E0S9_9ROSI|nr:hypothetical protein Dsin_023555 [Dipteronia sinensis]